MPRKKKSDQEVLAPEMPDQEVKEEAPVKVIPKAIPSNAVAGLETAMAKVTTMKFVGVWVKLQAGELVTAPRESIKVLRDHGLVE